MQDYEPWLGLETDERMKEEIEKGNIVFRPELRQLICQQCKQDLFVTDEQVMRSIGL